MEAVKGVWIRRKGCMWDAEVCEKTFEQFCDELQAFANEEHAPYGASPYIITKEINGHFVDVWYDENFLSYGPVPSGMDCGYVEPFLGMLFITGGDDETGECVSLSDEVIQDVLASYRVPTLEELAPYASEISTGFAFYMMGYKLVHFNEGADEDDSARATGIPAPWEEEEAE